MRYVAASTEKEIAENVVHKDFAFLEKVCSVRKATFYQWLRTHIIKTSIFNREGKKI